MRLKKNLLLSMDASIVDLISVTNRAIHHLMMDGQMQLHIQLIANTKSIHWPDQS